MADFDAEYLVGTTTEFSDEGAAGVFEAEYSDTCPAVDPDYPVISGLESDG